MTKTSVALSCMLLCLLAAACKELPNERGKDNDPAAERSKRARQAAEEQAERAPAKPTSPVAAPGAVEPPLRASEVPQRLGGTATPDDLPSPKQLPVAEDFQPETAAAIVKGNYHAELDSLETELKADGQ